MEHTHTNTRTHVHTGTHAAPTQYRLPNKGSTRTNARTLTHMRMQHSETELLRDMEQPSACDVLAYGTHTQAFILGGMTDMLQCLEEYRTYVCRVSRKDVSRSLTRAPQSKSGTSDLRESGFLFLHW